MLVLPARSFRTVVKPSMIRDSRKLTRMKPTETVNVKKISGANIGLAVSIP